MLNIFYGREKLDKEKFMYETIAASGGKNLVIVPDQYTLEGEKQAFKYLGKESLIDVEIISMSRLGYKLLEELGGSRENFIDKYGRHMVLSSIVKKQEENIQVFKGALAKNSFVELLNNFISEMKQYEVSPQLLQSLMEPLPDTSLLKKKLKDLNLIYGLYEKAIEGKYVDSEDYVNLYIDKIDESKAIGTSKIWVYGFDSFAPKALKVLQKLMKTSVDVNVVLTYDKFCRDEDLFQLPALVINNLEGCAVEIGCGHNVSQIDDKYAFSTKVAAVNAIEQELYAVGKQSCADSHGLTIVRAANMYNEAESAASYILHLLRDKGLRYRDIVVICNDQTTRSSILKRVFSEYEMDFFADRKRGILNSPIVIFIVALLEAVAFGYRTTDIFKLLKTGFTSLDSDSIEQLENYAIKYRIKGSMWKKTFPKGEMDYGTEGLDEINNYRADVIELLHPVEELFREVKTTSEFVERFYDYLTETLQITDSLVKFIDEQKNAGLIEEAEETSQIWANICSIFDQIVQLNGDEEFQKEDFIFILKAGLDQIEVGLLPPTVDDILVGTMQRTRAADVKAMLVVGANEGLLPAEGAQDALFTREEMDLLADTGSGICKSDKIKNLEEQLAIYRNLSKPSEYLWISFSASDEDGKEIRGSEIIDSIMKIFPDMEMTSDVLNREDPRDIIGGKVNTFRHLTENLNLSKKGEKIHSVWRPVLEWFKAEDEENVKSIDKCLKFTNKQVNLPVTMATDLFKKDVTKPMSVSPSRLERFSRCPFAHFVSYGLKPEERRIFQATGREIGDIYHSCLMELSEMLTEQNAWETVTQDECRQLVRDVTQKQATGYRDGLFSFSNEEKYKTSRIEEACFYVCWSLIEQVRSGKIQSSQYEVSFGRGRNVAPVEVDINGETVYIEGKIDRLDVLENDRVKIIDYKTGNEHFDITEAKAGYRLQLMLYMKAAREQERKPAGIFYFLIGDPRVDVSGMSHEKYHEKISKDIRKSFRLDGIMVNDPSVIEQIAGDFEESSDVVPLKRLKDGTVKGSKDVLLSEEEFEELQKAVDGKVEDLCRELLQGRIEIKPKKSKDKSLCDFCEMKGICRFDESFSGCRYEVVK